jgi:transmembrane sensor
MTPQDAPVRDAAALWMARSRDPRFSDWAALTDWLEADPAHNQAYEAAFAAHDAAGEIAQQPLPEWEPVGRPRWRLWGAVGLPAAAAAALAVFAIGLPQLGPAVETVVATRLGEHRLLRLDDGTVVDLNGGSRLVLNSKNVRTARLEAGEAMFGVVHDQARPFTVDVGGERLVDIGTRFDVVRTPRGSQVAVAEGAVLYDPDGAAVRLDAGKILRKRDDSDLVEVADVRPGDVGTWRKGKLIYRAAPLSQIAEDLSRLTGARITVAPALADRPFTGAIVVDDKNPERLFKRLGNVLNVAFSHRTQGWFLSSTAGATR